MEDLKNIEKDIKEFQSNILSVNELKLTIENQKELIDKSLREIEKNNDEVNKLIKITSNFKDDIIENGKKLHNNQKNHLIELVDVHIKRIDKLEDEIGTLNDKIEAVSKSIKMFHKILILILVLIFMLFIF